MKIAVKDANVLIDLIEADILDHWFRLGIETHTTDLVRHEIHRPEQRQALDAHVSRGTLLIAELSAEELHLADDSARRLRVSMADASALALARKLGAALLSGDSLLRKAAAKPGIEVRGVLWVFDELVKQGFLSPSEASDRLKRILVCGSFLPLNECAERFSEWDAKADI